MNILNSESNVYESQIESRGGGGGRVLQWEVIFANIADRHPLNFFIIH